MDFILGCNYWASNAGAEMWRNFDKDVIKEDLRVLRENGVTHMRVFPNWRDFQPIMPLYNGTNVDTYVLEGERYPENEYYLDEERMGYFRTFLNLCEEAGIKLIVGLITGWMSGRLFIPPAIYEKNVITNPIAVYFEQLFVRGFVRRFKDSPAILAWDLGNECNCMGKATRYEAVNWTATIANAIKAEDSTRPIVSGMHGIEVDQNKSWRIQDQAAWTDILTTHPYAYWCAYTRNDYALSLRTTMHATAQNKYYAECGGKPCLCEEIGTMGPMLCSDEAAADFMRVNLFSLWANGSLGVMWWCAHEQTPLVTYPYTVNMVETELGLLREDRSPKPVMLEIKKFSEFLKKDIKLNPAKTDAVCLLTRATRHWGICYAAHVLARRAGLNLSFAYADDGIPEAEHYILPSINSITVMELTRYKELIKRIENGAHLYITMDNCVLSNFEELAGVRVLDSYETPSEHYVTVNGKEIRYQNKRYFKLGATRAEVLVLDNEGNPAITKASYGKGTVTCVAFPLEDNLIDGHDTFSGEHYEIYKYILGGACSSLGVKVTGEELYTTYHCGGDKIITVTVNHYATEKQARIEVCGYKLSAVHYGDPERIKPYDALVLEFTKEA